jgi:ribosomal protein L19
MSQQESPRVQINADALKTEIPRFDVGDTLNVHQRIVEGDKERVQVYSGVLINRKGRGMNEMITSAASSTTSASSGPGPSTAR